MTFSSSASKAMASSNEKLKIKIVRGKPEISYTVVSETVKSSLTSVDHEDIVKSFGNEEKLQSSFGNKRSGEEMIDGRSSKRLKMDPLMAEKCLLILKKITKHPYALCFKQPVDPVAYELPHYLSIISKPMDLATIESKLVEGLYATAHQFESDIRLTFSNAMRYHPFDHAFHVMAKELNSKFSAEWSVMEPHTSTAEEDNWKKELIGLRSGCREAFSKYNADRSHGRSYGLEESCCKLPPKKRSHVSKVASDQSGSFTVNSGSKSWVQRIPPKSTYKTGKRLHIRPTGCQKKVSSLTTLKTPTNPNSEKTVPEVANPQTPLQNIFQKTVPKVVNKHKSCDNYANYEDRRSPACGIPISPIKVMRSEMLKERFANIIGKARNQITSHDTQQRQQERKAARLAIEKVERSVEFEDNISSLRCLENMIGHFSFIDPLKRYDTTYVEAARSMTDKLSPLERLGLYLKDDYQFMHEDEQCDDILLPQEYEEGEIKD